MKKIAYESPELDIRWFEPVDDILHDTLIFEEIPGDDIVDEDW